MNKIITGMTSESYHKNPAIGSSTLSMASKDPYSVEWQKSCPVDEEKIKTFDFGTAMHTICLEPHLFDSEFVVMPEMNLRTNAGKGEKTEFLMAHKDHKILTAAEYKHLRLMFESVMAHKQARALIEADGLAEASYFWTDEKTGIQCKCRPDKHIHSRGLLVDVKTTPDLKKFCYSVEDYRYFVQDPWYCDGVSRFTDQQVTMEFLVIQKTIECGRYPVRVVRLPEEAIIYGRKTYRDDLDRYADFADRIHEPQTAELEMHFRFMDNAYDSMEIQLDE